MQIRDCLTWAIEQLKLIDTPALDAEILLAHVLKYSRAQLYSHHKKDLENNQKILFEQLVKRRQQGEPVAYLIGYREFWSLSLKITPAVLIPRPETELLVETVLAKLPQDQPCKIADLGTGSGAIAIAIASERPKWSLVATDKSAAALAVARQNADDLQIKTIEFRQGDWFTAINPAEKFTAIISNPPYISETDTQLQAQVRQFEPVTALIAKDEGLADLATIIKQAYHHLAPQGWLLLEHGYNQAATVRKWLADHHYYGINSLPDLSGIERITVAQHL